MRLTVTNWTKHVDLKTEFIPTIFAASILIATWVVNRKSKVEYTAHMHPYKTPKDSVLTMPGIYVTKSKEESHHANESGTTRTQPRPDDVLRLDAPADEV